MFDESVRSELRPVELPADAAGTLAAVVHGRAVADRAEADQLALAAHWADLHPVPEGEDAESIPLRGMERSVALAGPGTPEVAEFACAELGAALGMSTAAGQRLVGHALELRHRLPRLWARVQAGDLPAWRARQVAERTTILPAAGAAWIDVQVAPYAHRIGLGRLLTLLEAALVRYDPDEARRRAEAARSARGVWLSESMNEGGGRSIRVEADALDAAAFDEAIDQIAEALAAHGDDDLKDLRRAKALGLIADPHATLDLLTTDDPTDLTDLADGEGDDGDAGGAGDAGDDTAAGKGRASRPRARRWPARHRGPTLYLHLSADALAAHHHGTGTGPGPGTGVVARLEPTGGTPTSITGGPVTLEQVMTWLGRPDLKNLRIQPVLDLADRASIDAYEVPDRIAETVYLRSPGCPFPYCANQSRRKDADHITPYVPPDDGGPPGQTTPGNLAAICRRHHRLKTHGGWTYTMPEPGLYLWRSPAGRRYLVDHTGTSHLPD